MSNKRVNKAYVRYDGTGRVIPGSLILNRFKPKVGNWSETPAYECCNDVPVPPSLRMLFSNITEVSAIIGDASNVANWNTYFDLPTYGNPFTSVIVVGNEIKLLGGSNIQVKEDLFSEGPNLGIYLLSVNDEVGAIVELLENAFGAEAGDYIGSPFLKTVYFGGLVTITGNYTFYDCGELTSFIAPNLVSINEGAIFDTCISLETIEIPSCTSLGSTVGNNLVFIDVTGNNVTLTVPSALMTCNSGNPDGDIQYLQANNTVTIVTV